MIPINLLLGPVEYFLKYIPMWTGLVVSVRSIGDSVLLFFANAGKMLSNPLNMSATATFPI